MLGGMIAITPLLRASSVSTEAPAAYVVWPAILASLAITMAVCGLINATVERIAYRPLRGAPRLVPLITAIAMSFILQNIALAWKGPNFVPLNTGPSGAADFLPQGNVFTFGSAGVYTWASLIVVLLTVPVLIALMLARPAHAGRERPCGPPPRTGMRRR